MSKIDNYGEKAILNNLSYHIITYGCQMNEHESEKIAGMLESLGSRFEADRRSADILVFNTCCVRENAERKIFGNIGAVKQLKKKNPNLLVIVCGCMTQQEAVAFELKKTFPFIDIVIGTHNLHHLPAYIYNAVCNGRQTYEIWQQEDGIAEIPDAVRKEGPTAAVNVMYGCNNFCSYCIVPYVRGRERSRDEDRIIGEINTLVQNHVSEVMLLGQNVNSYGKEKGTSFALLLEKICTQTEIKRIRFMTSHPKDLSDELIEVIARHPQICRHIHLPVQSGSNRILQAMNRKYTREGYLALVDRIRSKIPGIAVTTDIIVGFPGETEQDFLQTMSLVEQVRFDAAFTFVYSKRSGTKAALMDDQVSEEVKKDRIVRLIALQNSITEEVDCSYVGSVQRVLVEGISTRDARDICGRADSGKMVNFRGTPDQIGSICSVLITEGKRTTLYGKQV